MSVKGTMISYGIELDSLLGLYLGDTIQGLPSGTDGARMLRLMSSEKKEAHEQTGWRVLVTASNGECIPSVLAVTTIEGGFKCSLYRADRLESIIEANADTGMITKVKTPEITAAILGRPSTALVNTTTIMELFPTREL